MKLAFYNALAAAGSTNGPFFDRCIEFDQHLRGNGDASRFVHVEFVFDERPLPLDGATVQAGDPGGSLCYSSSPRDGGVRFKQIDLNDGKWTVANIGLLNPADLRLALNFCKARLGMRYDWAGILGFVLPFGEHDDQDRFCSEAALELMQRSAVNGQLPRRIAAAIAGLTPWRTSPAGLYVALTRLAKTALRPVEADA